ncbi:MAG: CoA transferase [Actinomycetota bacterium]|nr:CoA transferase [Actinomycetota bacterium]
MGLPPHLAAETCTRRLRALDALGTPAPGITWHGPARFAGDRPGSEAAVQALCGLMAVHGRDRRLPRRLGLDVASVAAGVLAAQGALAAALAHRRGTTAPVQTSVLQAGLVLCSHYFVVATGLGDALPGPPLPAPGPPFRSADDRWFEIETLDAGSWKAFWTDLGVAPDADLGRAWTAFLWRYERATCSLPPGLHEATARRPLDELRRTAARAGVSLVPLRDYADVLLDPGTGVAHPTLRPYRGPGVIPTARSEGGLPLAGLRVVEATSRIQGPFAGMLLRMLGADVVRVQPPQGDYGRAAITLHREKASVQLDLEDRAGRAELVELVAGADVFLHNWRPGKAEVWRLGFDDLAGRHRGLVYASASGWGERGGPGDVLGTDFLVQAYTGMGQGLHPEGEPPFPSRMILCDLFGALVTAEGVLAGLYRRDRDGGSCEVSSSLLAGAMALQAHVLDGMAGGEEEGRRRGRPRWGVLDRPIATADGWLVVSADGQDFETLGRICGVTAEGPDADQRIAARLAEDSAARGEEALVAAGIPAAAVADDLPAVAADPRLSGLFEAVAGGVAPRAPWSFG